VEKLWRVYVEGVKKMEIEIGDYLPISNLQQEDPSLLVESVGRHK
jgi:hypothetical protein